MANLRNKHNDLSTVLQANTIKEILEHNLEKVTFCRDIGRPHYISVLLGVSFKLHDKLCDLIKWENAERQRVYFFRNKYVSITTDFYKCDITFPVLTISCHAVYAILKINTYTNNYKYRSVYM